MQIVWLNVETSLPFRERVYDILNGVANSGKSDLLIKLRFREHIVLIPGPGDEAVNMDEVYSHLSTLRGNAWLFESIQVGLQIGADSVEDLVYALCLMSQQADRYWNLWTPGTVACLCVLSLGIVKNSLRIPVKSDMAAIYKSRHKDPAWKQLLEAYAERLPAELQTEFVRQGIAYLDGLAK
jgi:hypothetical protein